MRLVGAQTPTITIPMRPDHRHEGHAHGPITRQGVAEVVDSRLIQLERDILSHNDELAQRNRRFFSSRGIRALNLVSSPGSGKTALLERTLVALPPEIPRAVIEGDQQTDNDAERIAATGAPVVQINTGKGCHLDAEMIDRALPSLPLPENSLLFIENVGNLVCPALFDLGETERVVIISVTEGDDKPLKYPDMFHTAQVCIINKIDLLPYVPFSVNKVVENARRINPSLRFFQLSAHTGEGMEDWLAYLC